MAADIAFTEFQAVLLQPPLQSPETRVVRLAEACSKLGNWHGG